MTERAGENVVRKEQCSRKTGRCVRCGEPPGRPHMDECDYDEPENAL